MLVALSVQVVVLRRVSQVQWSTTARPALPSAGVAGAKYLPKTRSASAQVVRPFTTTTRAGEPVTVVTRPQNAPAPTGRGRPVEDGDGLGITRGGPEGRCCFAVPPAEHPATASSISRASP